MTLDYERKGVYLLNESALDDFVDRCLTAEADLAEARQQLADAMKQRDEARDDIVRSWNWRDAIRDEVAARTADAQLQIEAAKRARDAAQQQIDKLLPEMREVATGRFPQNPVGLRDCIRLWAEALAAPPARTGND